MASASNVNAASVVITSVTDATTGQLLYSNPAAGRRELALTLGADAATIQHATLGRRLAGASVRVAFAIRFSSAFRANAFAAVLAANIVGFSTDLLTTLAARAPATFAGATITSFGIASAGSTAAPYVSTVVVSVPVPPPEQPISVGGVVGAIVGTVAAVAIIAALIVVIPRLRVSQCYLLP